MPLTTYHLLGAAIGYILGGLLLLAGQGSVARPYTRGCYSAPQPKIT